MPRTEMVTTRPKRLKTGGAQTPPKDTRSIPERINAGVYESKVPYPERGDPEFKAKREAYRKAEGEGMGRFMRDLFEDCGVQNNPKRDLLWQKAWDLGHSSGYHEVYNYFTDLVELIQ